jgi:hypothetical protein
MTVHTDPMRTLAHRSPVLAILAAIVLLGTSCEGDGDMDDGAADTSADTSDPDDDGSGSGDGTMEALCDVEERDEEFVLGLAHEGDALHVAIASAEPASPLRGDNAWTLAITDASGAAMDGMELSVRTWMPDHAHGSPVPVEVEALEDGEYRIEPINLFMAGYWEITITSEAPADAVVFKVCVE